MTLLLILVGLCVAGYIAYQITKSKVASIDTSIVDALTKAANEIEEVAAKAERLAPKNETVKMAAKATKTTKKVMKPKNDK